MRIRRGRPDRFTQVPNATVDDLRLDVLAVGLLLTLLRMPDGFNTTVDEIARRRGPGRRKLYTAMRTLVSCGYVLKIKHQTATGKWATDVYVFDTPADPAEVSDLLITYAGNRAVRVEPSHLQPQDQPASNSGMSVATCGNADADPQTSRSQPTSQNRQVGNRQVGFREANPKTVSEDVSPDPEETDPATHTETPDTSAELTKAREITGRLNLAKLDAKPKQVVQVTHALAQALRSGMDPARLEQYAHTKISEARTVKYLLGAFVPERLTAADVSAQPAASPVSVPRPARCEDSRHRHDYPEVDRFLYDGDTPIGLCPTCGTKPTTVSAGEGHSR